MENGEWKNGEMEKWENAKRKARGKVALAFSLDCYRFGNG